MTATDIYQNVHLQETFRGPMDLLLYLIKRDEIDIQDIPIHHITREFISVIDTMEDVDVDQASEFVSMASMLMEIKSRMLLPPEELEEEEEVVELDPRAGLVEALLEYKRFKEAAAGLEHLYEQHQLRVPRVAPAPVEIPVPADEAMIDADSDELFSAFVRIMMDKIREANARTIVNEEISTEEVIESITASVLRTKRVRFSELLRPGISRDEIVVYFIAMLEMIRLKVVWAYQNSDFSDIYLENRPLEQRSSSYRPDWMKVAADAVEKQVAEVDKKLAAQGVELSPRRAIHAGVSHVTHGGAAPFLPLHPVRAGVASATSNRMSATSGIALKTSRSSQNQAITSRKPQGFLAIAPSRPVTSLKQSVRGKKGFLTVPMVHVGAGRVFAHDAMCSSEEQVKATEPLVSKPKPHDHTLPEQGKHSTDVGSGATLSLSTTMHGGAAPFLPLHPVRAGVASATSNRISATSGIALKTSRSSQTQAITSRKPQGFLAIAPSRPVTSLKQSVRGRKGFLTVPMMHVGAGRVFAHNAMCSSEEQVKATEPLVSKPMPHDHTLPEQGKHLTDVGSGATSSPSTTMHGGAAPFLPVMPMRHVRMAESDHASSLCNSVKSSRKKASPAFLSLSQPVRGRVIVSSRASGFLAVMGVPVARHHADINRSCQPTTQTLGQTPSQTGHAPHGQEAASSVSHATCAVASSLSAPLASSGASHADGTSFADTRVAGIDTGVAVPPRRRMGYISPPNFFVSSSMGNVRCPVIRPSITSASTERVAFLSIQPVRFSGGAEPFSKGKAKTKATVKSKIKSQAYAKAFLSVPMVVASNSSHGHMPDVALPACGVDASRSVAVPQVALSSLSERKDGRAMSCGMCDVSKGMSSACSCDVTSHASRQASSCVGRSASSGVSIFPPKPGMGMSGRKNSRTRVLKAKGSAFLAISPLITMRGVQGVPAQIQANTHSVVARRGFLTVPAVCVACRTFSEATRPDAHKGRAQTHGMIRSIPIHVTTSQQTCVSKVCDIPVSASVCAVSPGKSSSSRSTSAAIGAAPISIGRLAVSMPVHHPLPKSVATVSALHATEKAWQRAVMRDTCVPSERGAVRASASYVKKRSLY